MGLSQPWDQQAGPDRARETTDESNFFVVASRVCSVQADFVSSQN
jgi:hypothetical protein